MWHSRKPGRWTGKHARRPFELRPLRLNAGLTHKSQAALLLQAPDLQPTWKMQCVPELQTVTVVGASGPKAWLTIISTSFNDKCRPGQILG